MIKLSSIPKLLSEIFILYYFWYQVAYEPIPYMSQTMCVVILVTLAGCFIKRPFSLEQLVPRELTRSWLAYGIISLAIGIIVAIDYNSFGYGMILYFSSWLFCTMLCIQINEIGSYEWVFKCIALVTILLCISAFTSGGLQYDRIVLGSRDNSNTIGLILFFGIASELLLIKDNIKSLIINLVLITLNLITIVLTGSRKALLAGVILIFVWFFFVMRPRVRKFGLFGKAIFYAIILAAIYGVVYYMQNMYVNTIMYSRFINVSGDHSFRERLSFYSEGWKMFLSSPLWGVGYKQFEAYSVRHTYSHSTYIELIACTGLIGVFLFFAPIILSIKTYIRNLKCAVDKNCVLWGFILLIIFFLGFTVIWQYDLMTMMFISMFFSFVRFEMGYQTN